MSWNRNFLYFFKNIRKKHRLSLRKEHNDSEVWYMHISPIEMLGGFIALLLVLMVIILSLAAFTPILELVPGYSGTKMREDMIRNIVRVDSIERKLNELQIYSNNISLIMDGKTPILRNVHQAGDSMRIDKPEAVPPSAADSALRRQMEGAGDYSLAEAVAAARRSMQSAMELVAPVKGVISTRFSPKEGRFGVGVATAGDQQILAIADGTVILSSWSPDAGHIFQVQHASNLVSTYKHSVQSLKQAGSRVRGGEVLGYTGEGTSGEAGKGLFEFELWHNGVPVDPESYIVF